ncbi:MAG: citramalate synthase [Planctomycetota bacterium]|jgi:2-isopropylmalate synthase|nr:citramalate synthase [Planctomycetota bacterium]
MTASESPSHREPPRQILVYDTTLRDGSQGEGVNFCLEDKLRLAQLLDDLGIHYIEGGWPGSNPKDIEFFKAIRAAPPRRAVLTAFGSTRRAGTRASADANLRHILAAQPGAACIVGKTWDLHVRDALRVSPEENLDMIASSIAYLKKRLPEVFFDAEHFFDGFRRNPEFSLAALGAAVDAGVDAVMLCDTNGGSLVEEVAGAVDAVRARFPSVRIGVHSHNDAGLAVANTIEAALHGAEIVQGCMNGFGERTGNADLCAVMPVLELRCGMRCIGPENLRKLTSASRLVYELANIGRRNSQPFVGESAFAHKGGLHVSAMARNDMTYEAFPPKAVGNNRRILISELAGRASIIAKYPELSALPEKQKLVLDEVMRLEHEGYSFENAGASFELLVKRLLGVYQPSFALLGFRASTENREGSVLPVSEASVKICIGKAEFHTVADASHGPVAALDLALRKALREAYPFFDELRLTDFRVHIVNAREAVEARVRVVIQFSDGQADWGTVGVSEDILNASLTALVDSCQYMIMRHAGGE